MRIKRYVKLSLIMMLGILMLMLSGCEKKTTSNKKEENVLLIEDERAEDALEQGTFESDTPKEETSHAKTLGGSKTLDIIPPREGSEDETPQESEKAEWIPGIW